MNPIVYGDYPANVRRIVGKRMPKFTPNQSKLLNGSFDFLGFNYYTGIYVSNSDNSRPPKPEYTSFASDMHATTSCMLIFISFHRYIPLFFHFKMENFN